MTRDERNEVRDYVKQAVPITSILSEVGLTVNHGGQCNCPLCGSGTGNNGKNTPGFTYYPQDNTYYCFQCESTGDVISLYEKLHGVGYNDALHDLAARVGINMDSRSYQNERKVVPKPVVKENVKQEPEAHHDYSSLFDWCQKRVKQTDYFAQRGLSPELVKRCGLGFNPSFEFMNERTGLKEKHPAILIPYDRSYSYFFARATDGTRLFKKPATHTAGHEPVWNRWALNSNEPIFVCESPIDALSVMEVGGTAVAVGGTGTPKLMSAIAKKHPQKPLIVALDNDKSGEKATNKLLAELDRQNIPYITAVWSIPSYPENAKTKDANEMLCSDRNIFANDVKNNIERANERGRMIDLAKEHAQARTQTVERQPVINQTKQTVGRVAQAVI